MMNTLANHGYLQRDGRNITRENAIKGLGDGLNFNSSLVEIMFDAAIGANPEPNATYFTLYEVLFSCHSFPVLDLRPQPNHEEGLSMCFERG